MKRAFTMRAVIRSSGLGLAGAALMAVCGCVAIPVDYAAQGSRHNVDATVQAKLQLGITSIEEVLLMLGEPDHVSDDGRCFGYAWSRVKFFVVASAGGYTGAYGELAESHLLQIWFDTGGRVSRVASRKAWGSEARPEET